MTSKSQLYLNNMIFTPMTLITKFNKNDTK